MRRGKEKKRRAGSVTQQCNCERTGCLHSPGSGAVLFTCAAIQQTVIFERVLSVCGDTKRPRAEPEKKTASQIYLEQSMFYWTPCWVHGGRWSGWQCRWMVGVKCVSVFVCICENWVYTQNSIYLWMFSALWKQQGKMYCTLDVFAHTLQLQSQYLELSIHWFFVFNLLLAWQLKF